MLKRGNPAHDKPEALWTEQNEANGSGVTHSSQNLPSMNRMVNDDLPVPAPQHKSSNAISFSLFRAAAPTPRKPSTATRRWMVLPLDPVEELRGPLDCWSPELYRTDMTRLVRETDVLSTLAARRH